MILAALLALEPQQPSPQASAAPRLEPVAAVPTAAAGAGSVSVQASTRRAALNHGRAGTIELFALSDPGRPRALRVLELGLEPGEAVTAVALPPEGDWLVATVASGTELRAGRALVLSLADGARLASFECGVGPRCIAFSADGEEVLIANEAGGFEQVGERLVSAPGSLTRVRFAAELARSEVAQIPFELAASGPTDGRTIERNVAGVTRSIPLENAPEFLEPATAVFLPDGRRALVTLQENDQVAYVDLASGKLDHLLALGDTRHPADLACDGRFEETGTLFARREPDGLALTPDGRCFLTADRGATGPGLDGTPPGKPGGGGRTLSVFDLATGNLVADTGPQLERAAAKAGLHPDACSTRCGSEPAQVIAFEREGAALAAVTLARAGALALVDLRDPARPAVLAVAPSGGRPAEDGPEGLARFRDPESQADYLYVANAGSGTLGVLRVR